VTAPVVTCCADGGSRLTWINGYKWVIDTDSDDTGLRFCPWCSAKLPVAEQATTPTCEFCKKPMPTTDGHGLGECAPICPTCNGTGSAEAKIDAKVAAEIEAAIQRVEGCHYDAGAASGRSDINRAHTDAVVAGTALRLLIARLCGGAS